MFDFLRQLFKPAEERQQELLHAYLDEALSPREQRRFEQMMADDVELRQRLAQMRQLKTQLRQTGRRRVPRNFTLDPAVYGRPQRQPLFQLYPAMRVATVLTAFFFVLAIGLDLFSTTGSAVQEAAEPQGIALLSQPETVEVTRTVGETVEESEGADVAADTAVEETVVEGEAVMEAPAEAPPAEPAAASEPATAATAPPAAAEDATTNAAETDGSGYPGLESPTGPAATLAAVPSPAPTATISDLPRPSADEEIAANRSATAYPAESAAVAQSVPATAYPQPTATAGYIPEQGRGLRDPWRPYQFGLGILLLALGAATLYVRRHS